MEKKPTSPSRGPNQDKEKDGGQRTIKHSFSLSGIGIHSGKTTALQASPAPPGTGIIFLWRGKTIPANIKWLASTHRGTTLGGVSTVEHFLSAAYALGIDNLSVKIDGDELPILDGSARGFVEEFEKAIIVRQQKPKEYFSISLPIKITAGDASLEALPYHGLKINFVVKFRGIGEQAYSFELSRRSYRTEIAPARTFGYAQEHAALKAKGIGFGASAENALVLDEKGYVNAPRFENEPVRHKILDLIGDLALLGKPLHAEIFAVKSGHALNAELVRRITNG